MIKQGLKWKFNIKFKLCVVFGLDRSHRLVLHTFCPLFNWSNLLTCEAGFSLRPRRTGTGRSDDKDEGVGCLPSAAAVSPSLLRTENH